MAPLKHVLQSPLSTPQEPLSGSDESGGVDQVSDPRASHGQVLERELDGLELHDALRAEFSRLLTLKSTPASELPITPVWHRHGK